MLITGTGLVIISIPFWWQDQELCFLRGHISNSNELGSYSFIYLILCLYLFFFLNILILKDINITYKKRKSAAMMNKELYKNLLLYLYFGISCSIINMEVSLFEKTYFVKNELYIFKYVFLHRSFFLISCFGTIEIIQYLFIN